MHLPSKPCRATENLAGKAFYTAGGGSSDRPQYGKSCGARSSPVADSERVEGLGEESPSRESLGSSRSGGGDVHGGLC